MKTFCSMCGVHFPVDFPKTLQAPCNFWGDHKMANLPEDFKLKVWNWIFSAPFDEATGFGIQMMLSFEAKVMDQTDTFEAKVPGWSKMSEQERQEYEKQHFAFINKFGTPPPIGYIKVKKKLIN